MSANFHGRLAANFCQLQLFTRSVARVRRSGSVILLALLFWSGSALAEWDDYCIRAQQLVATTAVYAGIKVHDDYASFADSDATSEPFVVQQYLSNPSPENPALLRTMSCKMRTAERINKSGAQRGARVALEDTSCNAVHRDMLAEVAESIPRRELRVQPDSVVIGEEERTFIGTLWSRPWPFDAVVRAGKGRIQLNTKALYVPYVWWIPMPSAYKGNFYCHLVAPAYLEALLRGKARP